MVRLIRSVAPFSILAILLLAVPAAAVMPMARPMMHPAAMRPPIHAAYSGSPAASYVAFTVPKPGTASLEPAIVVEIRDARTGAAIAADAQGTVTDGTYSDQLTPYEGGLEGPSSLFSRRAALERPGTYAVHVTHAGYMPWNASGVAVSRGECHVRTQRLHANLQPVVN